MPWVLLDVAIAAVALLALALVLLKAWRAVRSLSRQVARSTETLSGLTPDVPIRSQR